MFSQENPCVLTDSDDDDALPLGDEVYEPESTDEADEPGPVAEDNRARRRRGRRPVEIPLPTDAEMQQAAQVTVTPLSTRFGFARLLDRSSSLAAPTAVTRFGWRNIWLICL